MFAFAVRFPGCGRGPVRPARVQACGCGGHGGRETPGHIPNPVAKPPSADGTAWGTAWESRSLPHHNQHDGEGSPPRKGGWPLTPVSPLFFVPPFFPRVFIPGVSVFPPGFPARSAGLSGPAGPARLAWSAGPAGLVCSRCGVGLGWLCRRPGPTGPGRAGCRGSDPPALEATGWSDGDGPPSRPGGLGVDGSPGGRPAAHHPPPEQPARRPSPRPACRCAGKTTLIPGTAASRMNNDHAEGRGRAGPYGRPRPDRWEHPDLTRNIPTEPGGADPA